MKLLIVSILPFLALSACSGSPATPSREATAEAAAPSTSRIPAPHPFAQILDPEFRSQGWRKAERDGDGNMSVMELKSATLASFNGADRFDGKRDGSVEVEKACALAPGICRGADANHDTHLAIDEFLDRVDQLFVKADRNRDGFLQPAEVSSLGGLAK